MERLVLPEKVSKETVFETVTDYLGDLRATEIDDQRPWGGFFVIDTAKQDLFLATFFPELDNEEIYKFGSQISPKILIVEPDGVLSWQKHGRRAEIWKAVLGPVGVKVSNTDEQPDTYNVLETGQLVKHDNEVRHRLLGVGSWGVVAEIWQHTIEGNPSNEDDIVRLEDAYGRG